MTNKRIELRSDSDNLPEWFKILPDNAYLNAADMRRLFGYSPKTSVKTLKALIPVDQVCTKSHHRNLLWRISTIRKFLKDHK